MDTKEKIIICLDLSSEMSEKDLKSNEGYSFILTRLFHLKRAIRMFVNIKSQISMKHEYALMILQESAFWLEDFTNDPTEFIERLEYLNQTVNCTSADLNSVFDVVKESVNLPSKNLEENSKDSKNYTLRLIIIYGRSNCLPLFLKSHQNFIELVSNENIFIDVLYLHDKNGSEINNINTILCELDTKGKSYILNSTWELALIYNEFAKLLSHPKQRAIENEAEYNIKSLIKSSSQNTGQASSKALERTVSMEQDKMDDEITIVQ